MTGQQSMAHGPLLLSVESEGIQVVPGDETLIAVPSGQPVTLQDVVWNVPGPDGLALRFRFVAPRIAGGEVDFDTAVGDIKALCDSYALPRVAQPGPMPSQIIISFSDTPLPFGEAAPDATQYFEAFSVQNGTCIWEAF